MPILRCKCVKRPIAARVQTEEGTHSYIHYASESEASVVRRAYAHNPDTVGRLFVEGGWCTASLTTVSWCNCFLVHLTICSVRINKRLIGRGNGRQRSILIYSRNKGRNHWNKIRRYIHMTLASVRRHIPSTSNAVKDVEDMCQAWERAISFYVLQATSRKPIWRKQSAQRWLRRQQQVRLTLDRAQNSMPGNSPVLSAWYWDCCLKLPKRYQYAEKKRLVDASWIRRSLEDVERYVTLMLWINAFKRTQNSNSLIIKRR